ncbi:hypothetical protein HU200_021005 [Digitaria exilis]|uniref:Integrator complex subunit 7-like C-terminal domain-containing protein n=1 Tax=Digitaria exilis TaxID=1010633 RepID=A0A835KDQ6_9POAL|nr:hypothetical protein HU200_021005 [Digitaria exilis]
MERIPAASAMDWSVDLDRGLRSRHHATRVGALDAAAPRLRELCACAAVPAPAPVASAYGVLPGEARVFAETMLLRLATEFRTAADVSMRARVVRTLLAAAAGARGVLAGARVADPDQLLRRVKAVYDTGSARDRALALRVFGCLAEVAEDSVHVRSLILSSLGASTALEIGKQMVLGSLEDVFKSEMLYSLSRLVSKLLPLIDDEDLSLECKSDVLRILQKIFCGKASGIHHFNGSELSKLLLAVESSLDYPSLEMQGIALEILVEVFCILKKARLDLNMTILKGSSLAYAEYQGVINSTPPASEDNDMNRLLYKIMTMVVSYITSLFNQVISREKKKVTNGTICMSSKLDKKYVAPFRLMLKLVTCYPTAVTVALGKLRGLVKELYQINGCDCSEVAVTLVEPFQTSAALEELRASNGNVELLSMSAEASLIETDIGKGKLDYSEFDHKNEKSITHDLTLCTLKFANSCYTVLCKTPGARCNFHDSIKGLIECVNKNGSQYWSTYEAFQLIMSAFIARDTCKIRHANKKAGDSKEEPNFFLTPSVWIAQELCALRMTKMLIEKQKYWEAYRSSMYCCRNGLWFTASFVFRKLADAFSSDSFSCWLKSLLLFSAGEIEMKQLLFPSALIKLVGELKTDNDLSEDLYCAESDTDSILSGCQELLGQRAKITGICERTCLANDVLERNGSSDYDFFFQRWFLSLRSSFLEIITEILGVLSTNSSAYEGSEDHLSRELIQGQILTLSSGRMNSSGDLEKDSYSLCHFAITLLLCERGNAKADGMTNGVDCLYSLRGGLQPLSSILQKFMELPFVVPKYFFRVRPCLGAELYMFVSSPADTNGMTVEPGFQLSLTLCLQWKRVLKRTAICPVKLYCILAATPCLHEAGTRSKQFEHRKTAEMVEFNSKLLQYIRRDLTKGGDEKDSQSGLEMVTSFASFEPADSGQGFSACLLDVSSFSEGSYQIKWHACYVDEKGSYFSLLPLNDGAVFSVRKS